MTSVSDAEQSFQVNLPSVKAIIGNSRSVAVYGFAATQYRELSDKLKEQADVLVSTSIS